jgi:hypothetical protein
MNVTIDEWKMAKNASYLFPQFSGPPSDPGQIRLGPMDTDVSLVYKQSCVLPEEMPLCSGALVHEQSPASHYHPVTTTRDLQTEVQIYHRYAARGFLSVTSLFVT